LQKYKKILKTHENRYFSRFSGIIDASNSTKSRFKDRNQSIFLTTKLNPHKMKEHVWGLFLKKDAIDGKWTN